MREGRWFIARATVRPLGHRFRPVPQRSSERPGGAEASTRFGLEERLGHDFGQVRIHADAEAAQSAHAVHAQAYTLGRHIVMGQDRYQPHSAAGMQLLIHELTHVVQQGNPTADLAPARSISHHDDPSEREADHVARTLIGPSRTLAPPGMLQRQDALRLRPSQLWAAESWTGGAPTTAPSRVPVASALAAPRRPGGIQPKLVIGEVDDPFEREADAAAAHIMQNPGTVPRLSRKCAGCDGGDTKGPNPKWNAADTSTSEVPEIVHAAVSSPGEPLDSATRSFMEPRFGRSFSDVRIHADSVANRSANAVGALAYTFQHDVVFSQGRFAPKSSEGRRLLAHELAHVAQQDGPAGTPRVVQRDLATPPPTDTPQPQPDLTAAQVQDAIAYNKLRYDEANTRLIQNIMGGPVTGHWTADNILAIASTQEEYGLKKDGKVGPHTFKFITQEQAAEGTGSDTKNCLTSFKVVSFPVEGNATPGPGGTTRIRGHHVVDALFSARCNCAGFQYRQFIAGVATASRGAVTQDLSSLFPRIPGGSLPIVASEDGNTACPSQNFGHREQPGQAFTTRDCGQDRYTNDDGSINQASGCRYRGEDFPKIEVLGLQTGDNVDLLVQFRGELLRNGRTIETRNWTDIDTSFTTP